MAKHALSPDPRPRSFTGSISRLGASGSKLVEFNGISRNCVVVSSGVIPKYTIYPTTAPGVGFQFSVIGRLPVTLLTSDEDVLVGAVVGV